MQINLLIVKINLFILKPIYLIMIWLLSDCANLIVSNNAQIEKLNSVLKAPKNSKSVLREELGKIYGILRAQGLFLCKKMNEDEKI